jgi:putative ABC transport system ATP-binding protein
VLLAAIAEAARAGIGFIIATHDPDVAAIADDIIQIDSGAIAYGDPLPVPDHSIAAGGGERGEQEEGRITLRTESVSKSYKTMSRSVHALDEVSVHFHSGELVALMGRSGSGKTTLLNVLAGWETPDSGSVSGDFATGSPLWQDVSVVPQTLGLIEELSIRDNVVFPLRLASERAEAPAVEALFEQLGLHELLDRFPREVSLGEQQRCAVARALVVSPRVVLADEPTAHQDAASARRVYQALRDRVVAGGCVVVATHDVRLLAFASRAVHMEDGRLSP